MCFSLTITGKKLWQDAPHIPNFFYCFLSQFWLDNFKARQLLICFLIGFSGQRLVPERDGRSRHYGPDRWDLRTGLKVSRPPGLRQDPGHLLQGERRRSQSPEHEKRNCVGFSGKEECKPVLKIRHFLWLITQIHKFKWLKSERSSVQHVCFDCAECRNELTWSSAPFSTNRAAVGKVRRPMFVVSARPSTLPITTEFTRWRTAVKWIQRNTGPGKKRRVGFIFYFYLQIIIIDSFLLRLGA